MIQRNASDLHITPGAPPSIRIDGQITPMNYDVLKPEDTENLAYSIMNDSQKKKFEQNWELDLSFGIPNVSLLETTFPNVSVTNSIISSTKSFSGILNE